MSDATSRLAYERAQAETAWRRAESCATPHDALPWLERAHRFTPSDQNLAFALASARMAAGQMAAARDLFARLAARHGGREILAGLTVCALALGETAAALEATGRALRTAVPDATIMALASRMAPSFWCGVTLAGQLCGPRPAPAALTLDGEKITLRAGRLPPGWRKAASLRVAVGGADALGSPVDLQAVLRAEGFVALTKTGIAGWAWHPGDPDQDPVLTILQDGTTRRLTARDLAVTFRGTTPLARPRGFTLAIDTARRLRVLGADGRDVLGSPLGGATRAPPAPRPGPAPGVAVVVPVYRGLTSTMTCLRAVLDTIGPADRVIVVNDASPDPGLVTALRAMQAGGAITLIHSCPDEPSRNAGFPAAANAGLLAAAGADVVLLNSDTIVYPGWLAMLRRAVHSAPDIGTATPLSNDATIFSYPDPAHPGPLLDPAEGAALAALAARVNAGTLVDVPTGHGFCLYIRAACLHETGLLRAALFAQGYGEENDFCERAARRGWRHVAVPAIYVGHEGGVSFGPARHHLLARNGAILHRLYPAYRSRIDAFIAADPLRPARTRLDAARLAARADAPSVLLVSHAGHGGTGRIVREREAALRAAGFRPITLRGEDGVTSVADAADDTPNLRFHLPEGQAALRKLLRQSRPARAEIHHLSGHHSAVLDVLRGLDLPFDVIVHDYQWICARMTLVTGEGKFCGEPPVTVCDACVARWGDAQEVPLTPAALRARSERLLPRADAVVVPSDDVLRRIRRHFPAAPVRAQPWQDDPPPRPARLLPLASEGLTVAAVGAIGMEKGYDILLACARDSAARNLPLRFVIAGYTIDDTPLLATGRAFVTGPFKPGEAVSILGGTGARLGFLPSIWPETWCFALTDLWQAGLDAAVFDIGAPAERVRRTGRGWVLPLGLPPARVNDALLNLQALAGRS
jgi:GT2 family glycosyltransferase